MILDNEIESISDLYYCKEFILIHFPSFVLTNLVLALAF